MDYLIVIFRTCFYYILINIVYRFMGKREVGKLSMVDFVVSILIAELVAMSIDKINQSIWLAIFPILVLVIIEVIISKITIKSNKVRNILDGNPSVIINKGKLNFKEMIKQRYNLDDLLSQLRDKSISSLDEVDYAILENNGRLSVFEKGKSNNYPLPIILDGHIEKDTLKLIGKDKYWLNRTLRKEKVELNDIFYGFYKEEKIYIIKKKELIQN